MSFVIDTVGDHQNEAQTSNVNDDVEEEGRSIISRVLAEYKQGLLDANPVHNKNVPEKKKTSKMPNIPTEHLRKTTDSIEEPRRKKKIEPLTKGKKWFDMPATELTEDVKRDLEVLQMRSALDPKRFYKKNDMKVLPKYFQVGKVLDAPLDYYNNRVLKKERKKTLVDELLADAEFNQYNKNKYKEVMVRKQQTHYKAWRQAKKLKKKK